MTGFFIIWALTLNAFNVNRLFDNLWQKSVALENVSSNRVTLSLLIINCQSLKVTLEWWNIDDISKFFCINCYPAGNCMFKVNDRNTRTRCDICSKLTIKTPERCQWCRRCVLLLTLNIVTPCSSVSIVNFEQANTGWVTTVKYSTIKYSAVTLHVTNIKFCEC